MRRRCRRIADSVTVPVPFDPEVFVQDVARSRGRPIELVPVPTAQPAAPCGLLVTTEQCDYILCVAHTSELHRRHILLHEVAHLLCGHPAIAVSRSAAPVTLMPDLSPELIQRVLGRTDYTEPQEQEAEFLASLILHRAIRNTPGPVQADAEQARLAALLGIPQNPGVGRD